MKKFGLFLILGLLISSSYAQSVCINEIVSKPCVVFDVVEHGIIDVEDYIFTWDFGDNQTADGAIVTHCYYYSGDFKATLSLLNKETGGYFEEEILLNIKIAEPLRLDILIPESISQGETYLLKHTLESDTTKTIERTKWIVDDLLVSENDHTKLKKLSIGQHKLRVELAMGDGLELCMEKIVTVSPEDLFTYQTRFLRDQSHYVHDSLVFSGNQIHQFGKITTLESVFFELDSDQLTAQIKTILDANFKILAGYQDKKIRIGTFTHTEGDFDRNRELSLSRSRAIVSYLKNKGMKEGSLEVADPLKIIELKNTCSDLLGCYYLDENLNRRSDFKIIDLNINPL